MCVYTYIYIYICMCMSMCISIYMCMYTYVYVYIYRERESSQAAPSLADVPPQATKLRAVYVYDKSTPKEYGRSRLLVIISQIPPWRVGTLDDQTC